MFNNSAQGPQHQLSILDGHFNTVLSQILNHYNLLVDKHTVRSINKSKKIRISLWIDKLREPTTNIVWKQNILLYAIILLAMIEHNWIDYPFNRTPGAGPIPRLSKYDVPFYIWNKVTGQTFSTLLLRPVSQTVVVRPITCIQKQVLMYSPNRVGLISVSPVRMQSNLVFMNPALSTKRTNESGKSQTYTNRQSKPLSHKPSSSSLNKQQILIQSQEFKRQIIVPLQQLDQQDSKSLSNYSDGYGPSRAYNHQKRDSDGNDQFDIYKQMLQEKINDSQKEREQFQIYLDKVISEKKIKK